MEVILLQKVANLGNIGDRVKVRSGYGRNFLLPKGKATLATPDNVARFEARRAELERAAHEHLAGAEERAAALKEFKLTIHAKAGTEGKLFGSIGTSDIAEAATRDGHKLERSEVRLPDGPLRTVGEHVVPLHLHADVDVPLHVDDRRRRVTRTSGTQAGGGYRPRRARSQRLSRAAWTRPVPPHSVEAEQAVLGGLLIDRVAWDKVADVVTAEDFYRPDHA